VKTVDEEQAATPVGQAVQVLVEDKKYPVAQVAAAVALVQDKAFLSH
jgi:hypothetical protein